MSQTESVNKPKFDIAHHWKQAVAERNVEKILALLDDNMPLKVPFKTEVITGRGLALETFRRFDSCIENFIYGDTLVNEQKSALSFSGNVGGHVLDGIDVFHLSECGSKIAHIEVFARPLEAIQALANKIKTLEASTQ